MPIEVIPSGRFKLVNPLQPENAPLPIEVIPSGRFKLVNPLQPQNAPTPIEVIPSGRFKLVNPLQNGMQLKLYPFSYIQITLPYCLYIKRGIKSNALYLRK